MGVRELRLGFLVEFCSQQLGGRVGGWRGRLISTSPQPWGSDLGPPPGLGERAGCSLLCPCQLCGLGQILETFWTPGCSSVKWESYYGSHAVVTIIRFNEWSDSCRGSEQAQRPLTYTFSSLGRGLTSPSFLSGLLAGVNGVPCGPTYPSPSKLTP